MLTKRLEAGFSDFAETLINKRVSALYIRQFGWLVVSIAAAILYPSVEKLIDGQCRYLRSSVT